MKPIASSSKIKDKWLTLTIRKKIHVFASLVFLIILLSIMIDFFVVNFSFTDFKNILEDNATSVTLIDTLENESMWFKNYIKDPTEENRERLEKAAKQTHLAISRLPNDYEEIGDYRYAKTWSIRNTYEGYVKRRDDLLKMSEESPGYVQQLYGVYEMQGYLQDYARVLMRYTFEDGTATYLYKIPLLQRMILIVVVLGSLLLIGLLGLVHLLNKTITDPIVILGSVSQKIAANDFFVADVVVENKDEIGELVGAFNKMKYAMGQYILALEDKRQMAELLHREEVAKLDMEKRLEVTNLELLKSQINPHFLFNTLNVISGMANLENATTTERMTKALSSLFRYNLKTPDTEVLLAQELKIARDYMYLQEMRFGSRISYTIDCRVDEKEIIVPTFSFQPLLENAVLHGLAKKEEGGKIHIRIWQESYYVFIVISDTGLGMSQKRLTKLREALRGDDQKSVGIGLRNIYKRIHHMYYHGEMEIFSREQVGTAIKLKIPQIDRGI